MRKGYIEIRHNCARYPEEELNYRRQAWKCSHPVELHNGSWIRIISLLWTEKRRAFGPAGKYYRYSFPRYTEISLVAIVSIADIPFFE